VMNLNDVIKEVERLYRVNGYKPKSNEEIRAKAVWVKNNIFPTKIRLFLDDVLKYYEFPKIFDFNRHLENNPHFKVSETHGNQYPSQDDPINTWCRKCMNSGLVPIHRFVGGLSYDFRVKCDCKASERYKWMKPRYSDFYPDETQFKWDEKLEFYEETYKREVNKLLAEQQKAEKLARMKGEEITRQSDNNEAMRDPLVKLFIGR
jgi:hypothetical protein